MSNSRIRRLFFTELKKGLKQPDNTLQWMVNQDGVIVIDNAGNPIEYNETNLLTHLIPAPAESETLKGDHVRYSGIYQVDANILLDPDVDLTGDSNLVLDDIVDKLQSIFKINMRLTDTSQTHVPEFDENGDEIPFENFAVQVLSPLKVTEAKRVQKTNWWRAHCYFDYRADTNI